MQIRSQFYDAVGYTDEQRALEGIATTRRLRVTRQQLWDADPHCHWCGVETVMVSAAHRAGERPNPLSASIDHLTTRRTATSLEAYRNSPVVLACWACNNARNDAETRELLPTMRRIPAIALEQAKRGKPVRSLIHRSPLESRTEWKARVAEIVRSMAMAS